jgi:hypothetical protein
MARSKAQTVRTEIAWTGREAESEESVIALSAVKDTSRADFACVYHAFNECSGRSS